MTKLLLSIFKIMKILILIIKLLYKMKKKKIF
jgi:hypothetical protein